jgi:hypothetical protein
MGAATIRVFLADRAPHGIRILAKSNWTGRGVEFSKLDWPRARLREDLAKPGVAYVQALRTNLVSSGVLAADCDGLVLSQDYTFNSPSLAAAALLGRISNKRVERKDAHGTPLQTLEKAAGG